MSATKNTLRRHVFARRDLISPDEARAAAASVAEAGLAFVRKVAAPGAIVGIYWAMRSELHTQPLMDALTAAGFRTALPKTRENAPLEFRAWIVGDDLTRGAIGNPEPADGAVVSPDVLFVPLAAFDAAGHRIGYGAGHYDRTIAALRTENAGVVAAGLAYDMQEVETVPHEPHDQPLDYVVTETRTLAVGAT